MHYPGLLKNRCGIYCYRLIFPPHLRRLGAPREARFSLGTKSFAKMADQWIYAFQLGRLLLAELTELSQEVSMSEFAEVMKVKIAAKREQFRFNEKIAEQKDKWLEQIRQEIWLRKQLAETSEKLTSMTMLAHQLKGQLIESRSKGKAVASPEESSVVTAPAVALTPSHPARHASLEALISRFNEHSEKIEKLADKTLGQRRSNLARFLDVVGPLTSTALGATDIAHYRDVIHSMPANLPKKAVWKTRPDDLSLRPAWYRSLGAEGLPTLSEQGQITHFHDVGPFLKWLYAERYVGEDFSNMLIAVRNGADYEEGGRPFTQSQLDKLTDGLWLADRKYPNERAKDWHFWAPLLGLTTGMRGDEIGRLSAADVIDVGDVTMLNVPGTKTHNAERLIPLPNVVLNAGFMQLVDWVREQNGPDGRLFPDWVLGGGKSSKNYSASLGRWFNHEQGKGLLARLEIWQPEQQVSFHSLRHTFATCAHHADVELKSIQMILGHGTDLRKTYGLPAPKDLGSTVDYIKPSVTFSPRAQEACIALRDAINSVDFGRDLTDISWLAWRKAKHMKPLL